MVVGSSVGTQVLRTAIKDTLRKISKFKGNRNGEDASLVTSVYSECDRYWGGSENRNRQKRQRDN